MEEAAGSTGRRAAVREVVEEAAVRDRSVVGAAARDVAEEAAVREGKSKESSVGSVLLDGLLVTGCRRASVMCLQNSQG